MRADSGLLSITVTDGAVSRCVAGNVDAFDAETDHGHTFPHQEFSLTRHIT